MGKWKYYEPVLDFRQTKNLWYAYTDDDGTQRTQRLQFLSTSVFVRMCERLCSPCERAAERLPVLLAQLRIEDSVDRWWLLCQLVGYGATLDGICTTEAGNGAA